MKCHAHFVYTEARFINPDNNNPHLRLSPRERISRRAHFRPTSASHPAVRPRENQRKKKDQPLHPCLSPPSNIPAAKRLEPGVLGRAEGIRSIAALQQRDPPARCSNCLRRAERPPRAFNFISGTRRHLHHTPAGCRCCATRNIDGTRVRVSVCVCVCVCVIQRPSGGERRRHKHTLYSSLLVVVSPYVCHLSTYHTPSHSGMTHPATNVRCSALLLCRHRHIRRPGISVARWGRRESSNI